MKNLVLCPTLHFLFFISIVYSVQSQSHHTDVYFNAKSTLNFTCNVSDETLNIQWLKGSRKISEVTDLKNRYKINNQTKNENVLLIDATTESDAGNYSCVSYQGTEEKTRTNFAAIHSKSIAVKVPSNVNVVEEERLRIECKVVGDPDLYWTFNDKTYIASDGDRVKLENYTDNDKVIRNGVFILENVTNEDRGDVNCVGVDVYTGQVINDTCTVRIKGKYAALWPFLGICAEVIVLCAIIVIYEKKRNKTELEESDTDQSPDQKNTPDHGKDANLRHRQ